MMCVDENGEDTEEPIVFPEWSFVLGAMVKRRDYRFDVLLRENPNEDMYLKIRIYEGDVSVGENWMIDPITNEVIPKPVREFAPIHYRRVSENV